MRELSPGTTRPRFGGLALLVDQRERWERGERVRVEDYLRREPSLPKDIVLDLLYQEMVLEQEVGEAPTSERYLGRFPELADDIALLFEVHDAGGLSQIGEVAAAEVDAGLPVISHYRALEVLGRGGMGVVYRAEDLETGNVVALKTVLVPSEVLLQSIRREIHALARVRHPGIVKILDEGVADGRPYYAMEIVRGRSLRGHVSDVLGVSLPEMDATAAVGAPRPAPLFVPLTGALDARTRAVLTLVRRLCVPLAFLHGEGIVHRDLKLENVLIRDDGTPVIIDFGLAAQFEGRLTLGIQQTGTNVEGTIHYMAPEVIAGRSVDARADLYALGCMLYLLLAGVPPFTGSVHAIAAAHLSAPPPPLAERVPGLPPALYALVERLLAKDPRDRLGYAEDVAAALVALGAEPGEATVERPRAYLYRPGFAGRREVLDLLLGRLADTEAGAGGLVLIGGESGVGKTRLLLEVMRAAAERDLKVLVGECSFDGGRPTEALRGPLQAVADRCRTLGEVETERVLGARGRVLASYAPDLIDLPGQSRHAPPAPLPAREAAARWVASFVATMRALAAESPVLLVLDDIQWADELTLASLAALRETGRVLVVASYRTEETNAALEALIANGPPPLVLARLPVEAVESIVGDMLAMTPAPPVLSRHLLHHTEGNPFFVAEYLRMAVEERLLVRDEHGLWRLPESDERYAALSLPGSLRALVVRRFAGLSRGGVALLSAAAVLGRESELAMIAEVSALGMDDVLVAATELMRAQILEETRPGSLRFVHDKLREGAYDAIEPALRPELHRAAARALERDDGALDDQRRLEERAAALSRHHRLAGNALAAVRYARLAGRHALRTSQLAEAIGQYETAIEILDMLAETPEVLALKFDVRLELYSPRMQLKSAADERMLVLCREAGVIAQRLGDADRQALVHARISGCLSARADYRQCFEVGHRALDHARAVGRREFEPYAAMTLTATYVQTGRYHAIFDFVPPIVAWLEEQDRVADYFDATYPPYVAIAGYLALAHVLEGRSEEGDALLAKAFAAARRAKDRYGLALVHAMSGWAAHPRDDGARAIADGEAGAAIARELGLVGPALFNAYSIGVGLAFEGHHDEAIACLEAALASSDALGYRGFRTEAYYGLTIAHLGRGDVDGAQRTCDLWVAFADATDERKLDAERLRLMSETKMRGPVSDPETARRYLHESLEIATRQHARVFEARTRSALASFERNHVADPPS